jgi:curli biogenesis system outer membrane secretion channel CsgG
MTYASPSFRLVLILSAIGGAVAGAGAQTPWSVARNRQLSPSSARRVQPKAWVQASEPRAKIKTLAPAPKEPTIQKPAPVSPAAPVVKTPSAPTAPVVQQPQPAMPARPAPIKTPPVATAPITIDSSSPIACELRLVRLSDGRVLVQRSRLSAVHMLPQMVSEMVHDFIVAMEGDPKEIVVISLGNRRQTPMGKALAKQLTNQVTTQMNRATRRTVYSVDLRKILLKESEIERATHLMTHPQVRKRIAGAQYAIQGGVAICGPETRTSAPADDTLNP